MIRVNGARLRSPLLTGKKTLPGIGLPPSFDIAKRRGLGMRLAKALAQQTEARILITRHAPGTEFVIELPLEAT